MLEVSGDHIICCVPGPPQYCACRRLIVVQLMQQFSESKEHVWSRAVQS